MPFLRRTVVRNCTAVRNCTVARSPLDRPLTHAYQAIVRAWRSSESTTGLVRARVWYSGQLHSRPLATKIATGFTLFGVGDIAMQRNNENKDKAAQIDLYRCAKMSVWGGFFNAAMGHAWYNIVEHLVSARGSYGIFQKICFDQLLWTPFIDAGFFSYSALVDGRGVRGVVDDLREKYWVTLKQNWKVWPMVHVITYSLVPLHLRVVWVTTVGVCWSMFLSFMANDFHSH